MVPIYCDRFGPGERVLYIPCWLTSVISTKEFFHHYPRPIVDSCWGPRCNRKEKSFGLPLAIQPLVVISSLISNKRETGLFSSHHILKRRACKQNENNSLLISVNLQALINGGLMAQISSKWDHFMCHVSLLRRKCVSGINHFKPSQSLNTEISCLMVQWFISTAKRCS